MGQGHYLEVKKWREYILQDKCQRSMPSHFMVKVIHFLNGWLSHMLIIHGSFGPFY